LVYLIGSDSIHGFGIWKSDGTLTGTQFIFDVPFDNQLYEIQKFVASNQGIFFTMRDWNLGNELWYTDGTGMGTYVVEDIFPGPNHSLPSELTVSGNTLFFSAYHPQYGHELWSFDMMHVGITDLETQSAQMLIFPNPATDRVTIQSNSANIRSVNLYAINGRKVFSESYPPSSNVSVNLNQLENGIYIVEVHTEDKDLTARIVVSN